MTLVTGAALAGCDGSDPEAGSSALAADAGERSASDAGTRKDAGKVNAAEGSRAAAGAGASTASERTAAQPAAANATADEQTFKLRFHAQIGDEPFACGQSYAAQGSTKRSVTPRDLRLFIQDVALVDDKGDEVPVKLDTRDPWQTPDVALLDFEDASGECFGTADTNAEITGVVPKGTYTALRFSNGVPDKLNHADPKTFPAPLKTPGMSWNWLLGLRFLRFELASESGADRELDAGADSAGFALHIGSTACSGSQNDGNITCTKPNRSRIELKGFEVDKSEIVLDVSKVLGGSDLSKLVECHSASAACEPMFSAFGLSYETGKPSADQSVYRLK